MRRLWWLVGVMWLSACGSAASVNVGGASQPTPTPAPTYRGTVLADRPAGYWRMGEASGVTMADLSGNHHDGTYEGTYMLGQPGALTQDANTAVLFDGKGDASIPASASLSGSNVTIEVWLKKRGNAYFGMYVASNSRCNGTRACFALLNHGSSGQLEFRVVGDPGSAIASTTALDLNSWHYVVATYDGAAASLYVDGRLDSTRAVSATPPTTSDSWNIGRRFDGYFADAWIDEVALYPIALSADQVTAHWHAAGF